jgi:hypothetical protein
MRPGLKEMARVGYKPIVSSSRPQVSIYANLKLLGITAYASMRSITANSRIYWQKSANVDPTSIAMPNPKTHPTRDYDCSAELFVNTRRTTR